MWVSVLDANSGHSLFTIKGRPQSDGTILPFRALSGLALTEHTVVVAEADVIHVLDRESRQWVRSIGQPKPMYSIYTPLQNRHKRIRGELFGVISFVAIHNSQLIVSDREQKCVYVLGLDGSLRLRLDLAFEPVCAFVAAGRELCVLQNKPTPHFSFYR